MNSPEKVREREQAGHRSLPFISLRNATFRLGDELIFPGTNWTFAANQHWAVAGGNGAGKSLFADCLRGRLPLVGGTLDYGFRAPTGLVPEDAIDCVAFEDRKLDLRDSFLQSRWSSFEDEALSVGEFLRFERVMEINPFVVGRDDTRERRIFERRLGRTLRLLALEPFARRALGSLSNGERQRVQLARALAKPLRLLILDEPLTGIDAASRVYLKRLLERLMTTRLRLMIITTHFEDLPAGITHLLRIKERSITAATPLAGQRLKRPLHAVLTRGAQAKPAAKGAVRTPAKPGGKRHRAPALPPETLVELRSVTVHYGRQTVLRDLDWTVRAGESWAVLGPNGSGKTTLLSLISGDHPQLYNNHVKVFGRLRGGGESVWEIKQQIGSVSPELHLHFDDSLTCLETVLSGFFDTSGLYEQPSRAQRAAARSWLARLRLERLAPLPLNTLSAGQQRMVLLARALVKEPRLLILDEPCQGLDPAHARLFLHRVAQLLRQGGATVLFVTHRPEEIPPEINHTLTLPPQTRRT